jgi:hypothetical protein
MTRPFCARPANFAFRATYRMVSGRAPQGLLCVLLAYLMFGAAACAGATFGVRDYQHRQNTTASNFLAADSHPAGSPSISPTATSGAQVASSGIAGELVKGEVVNPAFCQKFDSAVEAHARGFTFFPTGSYYLPGPGPVGGAVGTRLRKLVIGTFTCNWHAKHQADVGIGVSILHRPISEAGWESANAIEPSAASSLAGIGNWAFTERGYPNLVVGGAASDVFLVSGYDASTVSDTALARALAAVLM